MIDKPFAASLFLCGVRDSYHSDEMAPAFALQGFSIPSRERFFAREPMEQRRSRLTGSM